jgi:hypothetical protein
MHRQMLKRCAQLFSGLGIGHSLVGQGLPERMRTATVALLGVIAAISMTFVAVIAHQGWSVLSLGPIPGPSAGPQAIGDGTALSTGEGGTAASTGGRPAIVATAELTAGSQGAQPGRAPAQPHPAGKLAGSQPLAGQSPAGETPGAPPASGEEPPSPPTTQPIPAGSNPTPPSTSQPGKGTAAVPPKQHDNDSGKGSEVEKGKGKSESSKPTPVPAPPAGKPEKAPKEDKPKEEKTKGGASTESSSHGHGYGRRK